MSAITHFLNKPKQTAVYFGNPSNDGRGKYTFSVIEEVQVIWHDEIENFAKDSRSRIQIGKDGSEFRANATVYAFSVPTGGWDLDGYMYLGSLIDLDSDPNPYDIEGAYEIKLIQTIPSLKKIDEKIFKILL